ncbi:MAG: hypothetical protein GQF41_0318 [Candidatus Rifleibacterium amylolyticum]|nr:MAG: hypothetical protein GQF41_0318 [Candidatus Rifleibacterium amylolyticum]
MEENINTQRLESIARELDRRKQEHQQGGGKRRKLRKYLRRLLMVVAIAFLVLASIFFFNFFRLNSDLIEGHIKQGIIPNLTQGRFNLHMGSISGNLLYGVEIENVLIQNPHFESASTVLTVPRVSLSYSLFDILFGKLILQKVVIDRPALSLHRNEKGRGSWDFSTTEPVAATADETRWQKQDRAQVVADRYLADIRINNLSILVPNPEKFISDDFAARIFRLPAKTWQMSGINLSLRKYPAEEFFTHILRVSLPERPDFMRFQVTRLKKNGNFTITFDGLGQNYNLAVDNIGQDGRKINLYDGKNRDRLNLEWVWARQNIALPERIRGLNGVLQVPQFNDLVKEWLPQEHKLAGSLQAKFACRGQQPLYDAQVELELASAEVRLPYVPVLENLDLKAASSDRIARISRLEFDTAGIHNLHAGWLNYADEANISTEIESDLAGDKMLVAATYSRLLPGSHQLAARLSRNAGTAEISFVRTVDNKAIVYSDFDFNAGIVEKGSVSGMLPLNLLPQQMRDQLQSYFSRVDLLGPLQISTGFARIDDWKNSLVVLSFDGARIINRINPKDFVEVQGMAELASGTLTCDNLLASIDNLAIKTSGRAILSEEAPFFKDYQAEVTLSTTGNGVFEISSERLQSSFGLTHRPDFDRIELIGERLASARVAADASENRIDLDIKKLLFIRHGKMLWAEDLLGALVTDRFNIAARERPDQITLDAKLGFFGIPMELAAKASLKQKNLETLSFKGGGANFTRLIEAIKTQPEGAAFIKKYPFVLTGNFNFAFLGSGSLEQPLIDGWLRFPALNLNMPQFSARLPFYIQVKNDKDAYLAVVKAGAAALKVKGVTFDLGMTNAEVIISNPFAGGGPKFSLKGDSQIFGAALKAEGSILPGQQKIEKFKISLRSQKIETLASEIARIGRFAVPFQLSGSFSAWADLDGRFAAPSSRGEVSVSKINLDFPLFEKSGQAVLLARDFSGSVAFNKRDDRFFGLEIKSFTGKILDAIVKISGKAHLKNLDRGFKPEIERLDAELSDLSVARVFDFLASGLLPKSLVGTMQVKSGDLAGKFSLSGTPDRILATGSASLKDGAIAFNAFKNNVEKLSAELDFSGRTDSGYARIGVKDLTGQFGRSTFKVSDGWLEDPTRTGRLSLQGSFDRVFPADMLAMLGGMVVKAVSFPKEGWLAGRLNLSGTIAKPELQGEVSSNEMTVQYDSGEQVFALPLGNSLVKFNFDPTSGEAEVLMSTFGLLGGEVFVEQAKGTFLPGRPFTMNLQGGLHDVDFAKLAISGKSGFRGTVDGTIKAAWMGPGERDAVFNLNFKNIHLPELPMIDVSAMGKNRIDFIEKPDFSVGQLNFYVTTDEEDLYKGRLLIADGLFAGPHLRLEIGNSEFNPSALQLDAKLMINPQSLRQTSIGKKLKKWTSTAQDSATGVPFVDLTVSGTWDKPELIAAAIKKRAEKRIKRNVIKRIFGGRRIHKASVEELMQWFPGWKKGM